MSFLVPIIVLGLVIAIHEFGHFIVAKMCGVGVLEFAIGFGPVLCRWQGKETQYALRMIPLGGFVKMVGEDAFYEGEKPTTPEDLGPKPEYTPAQEVMMADRSRWFVKQPLYERAAVVFAGPLFNILSAFVIGVSTLLIWGANEPVDKPVIGSVLPGYPAEKAGVKVGDTILAIDGATLTTWEQLAKTVIESGGKELELSVERSQADGTKSALTLHLHGDPDSKEMAYLEGATAKGVRIGITPALTRTAVGVGEALQISVLHMWKLSVMSVKGMVGLFIGQVSVKNLSGPIFIIGETVKSADRGLASLLEFVVFLSVSLAVLNLLPIPVLDGGHLLFMGFEALRGKPLSVRTLEYATRGGMVFLLALMAVALGNDLLRLIR